MARRSRRTISKMKKPFQAKVQVPELRWDEVDASNLTGADAFLVAQANARVPGFWWSSLGTDKYPPLYNATDISSAGGRRTKTRLSQD